MSVKAKTLALVAEIDPAELAVRMLEVFTGTQRPAGQTARQALETLSEDNRRDVMRAAAVAVDYIIEQLNAARKPS